MIAKYLHIQMKLRMPGSRIPVVQDVTVFVLTHISFAKSFCSMPLALSLALSHSPNSWYFIVYL